MNIDLKMLACDGKHKHLSYQAATVEMKRVNKQKHRYGKLNVYRCKFCGHYHVGRSNRRD